MQGRRRTIQEFNAIEEYFRTLDVNSRVKTRKTEVLQPCCSGSDATIDHLTNVPNIKVMAKKIKLIIEDGAQIKFSSIEEKLKEKNQIASIPNFEQKDKSWQKSEDTSTETKQLYTERLRAQKDQKNTTKDQWLRFFQDQDQQINDQLNFELSQLNQNQNINFFIKEDQENFFDEKQTLWGSQYDLSDFWSFQLQSQSQQNSVTSDAIDVQMQNILEVLQTSLQIKKTDNQ